MIVPWVRVDDAFYDHPKFLDRTAAEIGLWLLGLAYCNRYLTDGYISERGLRRTCPDPDAEQLAARLVHAGLWETAEGGWLVHNYHDHQPSAETIRAQRRERSESGKKGAESRWGTPGDPKANGHRPGTPDGSSHSNSHSSSNGTEHGKLDAPSRPIPPPSVTDRGEQLSSSVQGVQGDDDDDRDQSSAQFLATAACEILGQRDYDRALAEGRVQAETRKGQRSYQRSCRRNAIAERGDEAKAVALAHPDWSPEQVADELDRQDSAAAHPAGTNGLATVHPIAPDVDWLAARPRCECGMPAGHPPGCALDAGAEP